MDDVWDGFNLKEIGIPFGGDEMRGCKILLTSRRADVCSRMRVDRVFPIPLLSKDEAWSLFQKTVGHSISDTSDEMHLVAKGVCEECAGLPLAILALGGALTNADTCEWGDILQQLRNSRGNHIDGIEGEVYTPIELSYRYLKLADAQSCFLHCSLFPEDTQISVDDLVRYGVGTRFLQNIDQMENARDRVRALVGALKRSSLLLQGWDKDSVKLHDVTRDVAISIASKDKRHAFLIKNDAPRWPRKDEYGQCKTISIRSKKIDKLPDLECYPKLQTLVLECRNLSLNIPDSFFDGMKRLEFLDLFKMQISTLESSLPNLIHLRVLLLHRCKLEKLAFLKKLCYLEILSLRGSDVRELSTVAGNLSSLRVLDARDCRKLKVIPAGFLSSLSCLEELYITEFDGWEVEGNASPLELNSLEVLTVLEIHLPNAMLLSRGIHFGQLIRFKIFVGCRFKFYDYYDSENLKMLKLNDISLKGELNDLMENAQSLYQKVEDLEVNKCNDMEHAFGKLKGTSGAPFQPFNKLSILTISNCELKYLFSPSTARGVKQLKHLCIEECERMEAIIGEDEEVVDDIIFSQLKHLQLTNLPILRSFCANVEIMSNTIEQSPSMHARLLFSAKFSFPLLRFLRLDGLKCIKAINQLLIVGPEARDSFPKLDILIVKDCKEVETIVVVETEGGEEDTENDMFVFPKLEDIIFIDLPNLKSFCSSYASKNQEMGGEALFKIYSKVKISHFKKLDITGLHSLKEIWHISVPTSSTSELTRLRVQNCGKLSSIAPLKLLGSVVHKLEKLEVVKCDSLRYVFESEASNAAESEKVEKDKGMSAGVETSTLVFLKLEKLSLPSFGCLQPFLKRKISFPMLKRLTLSDESIFEEIWEGRVPEGCFLGKVRDLRLEDCSKLESVCGLLQRFEGVEKLVLNSCSSLEAVFNFQGLDATERLALETVSNRLKHLSLGNLGRLEDVWRMEPQGSRGLPLPAFLFSNLTSLGVSGCHSLKYVLSLSIARALSQITYLSIETCNVMEEIVVIVKNEEEDSIDHEIVFPQLRFLWLKNLPKLRSFCGANNVAFQFPSLKDVHMRGCPKLSTFTHGPTATPDFEMYCDVGRVEDVSDINKQVQQGAEEMQKKMTLDNQDQQC